MALAPVRGVFTRNIALAGVGQTTDGLTVGETAGVEAYLLAGQEDGTQDGTWNVTPAGAWSRRDGVASLLYGETVRVRLGNAMRNSLWLYTGPDNPSGAESLTFQLESFGRPTLAGVGLEANYPYIQLPEVIEPQRVPNPGAITVLGSGLVAAIEPGGEVGEKATFADLFGDYVVAGLLPTVPSPAGLNMAVPEGAAYAGGVRIEKAEETPRVYTASRDTYVDLGSDGVYVYTEVANGAAAPALVAGRVRLFRAVTGTTAITGVTDLRRLSTDPKFGTRVEIAGLEVVSNSNTSITVRRGVAFVPEVGRYVELASDTTITFGAGGAALGTVGAASYNVPAAGWIYVYLDASGQLVVNTTVPDAPYRADARTQGGNTGRRLLEVLRAVGANDLLRQSRNGDWVVYRDQVNPGLMLHSGLTATGWTLRSLAALVPPTSRRARIHINANNTSAVHAHLWPEDVNTGGLWVVTPANISTYPEVPLTALQQVALKNAVAGGSTDVSVLAYMAGR